MDQPGRERQGPAERFAGEVRLLDIRAAAEALRLEKREARDGHRQITLVHEEGLSVVLFDFEPGGRLPNHRAEGLVLIQVIDGEVEVAAREGNHVLTAGSILVLEPGVSHDVTARAASQMLLTVHLRR